MVKLETGTSTEEKKLDSFNLLENDTKESRSRATPDIKTWVPFSPLYSWFLENEMESSAIFPESWLAIL